MKLAKHYLVLLLALLASFQFSCGGSDKNSSSKNSNHSESKTLNLPEATADHVVDGDTIVVIFNRSKRTCEINWS